MHALGLKVGGSDVEYFKFCMTISSLKILHLSDLHFGMSGQKTLWPTFKNTFYKDIERLTKKAGPWETVVFTGDLTQTGSAEEFSYLTDELRHLWNLFEKLGFQPSLLTIPGNHDLRRPEEHDAHAVVMSEWDTRQDIRKLFWKNETNEYKKFVSKIFDNYTNWKTNLASSGIPQVPSMFGVLPGDFSAQIENAGLKLGIVGLNSAWLQLSGSDYEGKLEVAPQQLHGATSCNIDDWVSGNDFNIIATHHPVSWFSKNGKSVWDSEIYIPDRFEAHLCGHMHATRTEVFSTNASSPKRSLQAASLFGLEHYGTHNEDRRHGYSLLEFSRNECRKIRQWPRVAYIMGDGSRKFIADPEVHYDDDEEYATFSVGARPEVPGVQVEIENIPVRDEVLILMGSEDSATKLSPLRVNYRLDLSHSEIRKAERAATLEELRHGRPVWIVSDWGLGTDEFIKSVSNVLGPDEPIFKLDIHSYRSKDQLINGLQTQLGFPFQQLGSYLDSVSPALLIADDVPQSNDSASEAYAGELLEIFKILQSFAKKLRVIITSRQAPASTSARVIKLKVLDEADTAVYISKHELGGDRSKNIDFVSTLHRHTDGVPIRLDTALKHVQLVGLSQLSSTNSDVSGKNASGYDASPIVRATFEELISDPSASRTIDLLKALAMFPAGETFNAIRRFNGVNGFYPQNADRLIELCLVDKIEYQPVSRKNDAVTPVIIIVRRQVREFLYATLSADELHALNRKAMSLYFGVEWRSGSIQTNSSLRFDVPSQVASVLTNATFMVMRKLRESVEADSREKITEAVNLTTALCGLLIQGDHFRAAYLLCEEAAAILENTSAETLDKLELVLFNIQWARSLRMVKKTEQSRDVSLKNLEKAKSRDDRQSININLALSYETLSEHALAIKYAKACVEISATDATGLQAKSIIIDNGADKENREKKLLALEKQSRKKGAHTVYSNLALQRAEELDDPLQAAVIAAEILIECEQKNDYYNGLRATIISAKGLLQEDIVPPAVMLNKLITGYHYLYSQRFQSLFNACHNILWKFFRKMGDEANLLRLYKHSSFIWRLSNLEKTEISYLRELASQLQGRTSGDFPIGIRSELDYVYTRSLSLQLQSQIFAVEQ